jgi:stage II sporulation protein GA (sporulation sigma-E factor processing peptidase)
MIFVTVYVDVLIVVGFIINWFLLTATGKLIHKPLKKLRVAAAAFAGSLSSLIIFMPELSSTALLAVRVLTAVIMVVAAFDFANFRDIYQTALLFFFISFVFAGIEYGVSVIIGGSSVIWHNSVLYVDISLGVLVIATLISYAVLRLLRKFLDGDGADVSYTVTIETDGKRRDITAKIDTGNNLTDTLTGKPIIICGRSQLQGLVDDNTLISMLECNYITETVPPPFGWKLIPFSTINSNGLLPAFSPVSVSIKNNEKGKSQHCDVYIGVAEADMDYAVFNPKILLSA